LDRINLLIDMMGDVDLGGAIALDYSVASWTALEAAARDADVLERTILSLPAPLITSGPRSSRHCELPRRTAQT
jgi:hypothetical protein